MKTWTVCLKCGSHTPYGCRTCPPPLRLTERGRDVLWACRFMAVLVLGLALAGSVDGWVR